MIKIKRAPRGAPFWRWYINQGKGKCEVGCLFCYNHRWPWAKDEWKTHELTEGTVSNFRHFKWEPGKCKQYEGLHDIMMSSVGDPFAKANDFYTSYLFGLAASNPEVGNHLRVLSKLNGFDNFIKSNVPSGAMFGSTICTLDEKIKNITMPNSASIIDALGHYLFSASNNGNPVFLSCEPMLKRMDLCELMELLNQHEVYDPTEIWVGKLNYGFGCEQYAMSDEDIIKQVQLLFDSYDIKIYLKREVKGSKALRDVGIVAKEGTVYEEEE